MLDRQSESSTIFLQAKHHCLWQELKKPVEGCDSVEVSNPKTGEVLTKYGYRFHHVAGIVTGIQKYDTETKYSTRYFGFKLLMKDGADSYSLDMPYQSQMLRRFLRVAPNIDWTVPLSITLFKGKKQDGREELGVWFQQLGETVKVYYTRENPRGMPQATQDPDTKEWDFKPQHRWLVQRLKDETIPDIEAAARRSAPPIQPAQQAPPAEQPEPDNTDHQPFEITDDDVPF